MTVARHISLDDEHVEKMRPYVEKHNGNLGAALREIINQAGKYGYRANCSAVDISMFNWMLEEVEGMLIPDNVLDEMVEPGLMASMPKLEEYLIQRLDELQWDTGLVLKYDNGTFPSNVSVELKGAPQKIKFAAFLLSQYLVKNSLEYAPLEVKYAVNVNNCMKVKLCRSNKKEARRSLVTFFGGMDEIIKTIKSRPAFWMGVIHRHVSSNYNMVTVHRNYLEDMFADKVPTGEIMIENLSKKPVQEIPLKEMLILIKEVYETSRIADRVDIDKDIMIVSHNYRTKDAVEKLKNSLVALLEASGHLYDAKSAANMIVLTHRKDVGVKINEIVDVLKTSNSTLDQVLLMFMAFLEGLKDMPDIPISLTALGRRIGKSLMHEYGKENGIKEWDLQNFQNALEIIDSRLHRVSEWKLEGKNLLYTIRKCHIASEGNTFDAYICHTARETFKGALEYAFGNKAELSVNKLLSHGDNFCEVLIRLQ